MCGIAGWLGEVPGKEQVAEQMALRLHHRGPDAQGICHWDCASLIHARLSIIDLSPTGAQPMSNEDGSIWTIFNGEIYNHHPVHAALEQRGHRFRGRSDTEIIPHLYEEKGIGFVEDLRGMFTIAIYDDNQQTLYLARDRFGIKPLFFAPMELALVFASEIGALLDVPGVDRDINPQAISDFLALSYIPAPDTFYRGIFALEPGELIAAQKTSNGVEWERHSYHRWHVAVDPSITFEDAVNRTDDLLTRSIASQIESDVPLGALLSGGIDSSLVSAGAQMAVNDSLQTFNLRFPDAQYDETWAAHAVAERIGSHHTTLDMHEIDASWEHITRLLKAPGQPFADTSLFPTNAISKLIRQHVTVALSGDGGDEAFGGYTIHKRVPQLARLLDWPKPARKLGWKAGAFAAQALNGVGRMPPMVSKQFEYMATQDSMPALIHSFVAWLLPSEQQRLLAFKDALPVSRHFNQTWDNRLPETASTVEQAFAYVTEIQTRLVMPNQFLMKVDIASMQESLEVRVPILDEDLFAYSLTVPARHKVQGDRTKVVLREIARRKLPADVAAKRKQGFAIPINRWIDGRFRARLSEELLGSSSKLPQYLNPSIYSGWLADFRNDNSLRQFDAEGLYRRVIMLLALNLHISRAG